MRLDEWGSNALAKASPELGELAQLDISPTTARCDAVSGKCRKIGRASASLLQQDNLEP